MGKTKGKILAFVICGLLAGNYAIAQNSTNYLKFVQNSAISFTLDTYAELENTQTVTNAFCLKEETASNTGHFYVKATAATTTTTPMPVSNLVITYYSTTSTSYSSLATADIPLTGTNQLLFIQAKKSTAYNFCYSVKLPAIGYNYLPGTYTFTLTFTMTEP